MIIDYEKKDVQILDPVDRHSLQGTDWNFSLSLGDLTLMFFCLFIAGFFFFFEIYVISIFVIAFLFLFYLIKIAFKPMMKKLHKIEQVLFNDIFEVKKFMVVNPEDIKEKVWRLPYEFINVKLDWNPTGDFNKYLSKVHIKTKDYFWLRFGNKTRQDEEWEAIFYFKEIPKSGSMDLT